MHIFIINYSIVSLDKSNIEENSNLHDKGCFINHYHKVFREIFALISGKIKLKVYLHHSHYACPEQFDHNLSLPFH